MRGGERNGTRAEIEMRNLVMFPEQTRQQNLFVDINSKGEESTESILDHN